MGTVVTVPPVAGVFLRQRGLEQWGRRAGFDMAVADMDRDYFMSIYVLQIIHEHLCSADYPLKIHKFDIR